MTAASAPGKLILFGEYAVLSGCVCLVAAVDRRIIARRHGDPCVGYHVVGAPMSQDTRLVDAILARVAPEDDASSWSTDVSALYDDGAKMGLGSSAATTAAIARAAAPDLDDAALFSACFQAHRDIQAGRGSGADIAAAAFGGVFSYQLHAPQEPFPHLALSHTSANHHGLMRRAPLGWPEDLRVEAAWLGAPASSSHLIYRVERALYERRDDTVSLLEELRDASRAAVGAFRGGDTPTILDAARRSDETMQELGRLIQEPLRTSLHRALVDHARAHGLVAKTSGAGAGDFSLLMGHRDADWDAALSSLPEGIPHVPLTWGAPGARVEHL
jgi:phosphomevalonate kinase